MPSIVINPEWTEDELCIFLNSKRKDLHLNEIQELAGQWLDHNAHVSDCEIVGYGVCTCGFWLAQRMKTLSDDGMGLKRTKPYGPPQ